MEITVGEKSEIRLKKVFERVIFETEEGEELVVCMRDGAFEVSVLDTSIKSDEKYYVHYKMGAAGVFRITMLGSADKVDR